MPDIIRRRTFAALVTRKKPDPRIKPPSLLADGAIAIALLLVIAFFSRRTIQPDSVAYFENAYLIAHGHWSEALQGYWSPGYSLMLVPDAWIAGDDHSRFLALAHAMQTLVAIAGLWLAAIAARRCAPPAAQRLIFWGCAWILLRWATLDLMTPDLPLCALLLLFVVRLRSQGIRDGAGLGVIAGAGFLMKTSSWPWLLFGAGVAAANWARTAGRGRFPLKSFAAGFAIPAAFFLALSVRAGHPTLGEVGPLNLRWYLGDLARRTPDTDNGPHAAKRTLRLPSGEPVPVFDFHPASRTYAPWSDPEAWDRGVPVGSRPSMNLAQAGRSWRQNLRESWRWLLPVWLGVCVVLILLRDLPSARGAWEWLMERPLLMVGVAASLMFLAVHTETRLLAPAAMLCILGAFKVPHAAETRSPPSMNGFTWVAAAGVIANVALYVPALASNTSALAANEEQFDRYFDARLANAKDREVVVVGSAGLWMGLLWRNHIQVAAQIGAEGEPRLELLSEEQRIPWLQREFESESAGACYSTKQQRGSTAIIRRGCTLW